MGTFYAGKCSNSIQSSAATTRSQDQGPIKSDLNTDSNDISITMLWKDMEVPFEVKLEQKPCRKVNFDGTVYNWLKVKLLYYSSIKQAFQCFLQLGNMSFSS